MLQLPLVVSIPDSGEKYVQVVTDCLPSVSVSLWPFLFMSTQPIPTAVSLPPNFGFSYWAPYLNACLPSTLIVSSTLPPGHFPSLFGSHYIFFWLLLASKAICIPSPPTVLSCFCFPVPLLAVCSRFPAACPSFPPQIHHPTHSLHLSFSPEPASLSFSISVRLLCPPSVHCLCSSRVSHQDLRQQVSLLSVPVPDIKAGPGCRKQQLNRKSCSAPAALGFIMPHTSGG